ncbi:nucleolar complex protein 4 homolog [Leptodactylus fuscus]|uniref:nucleolar complex protein 4 homolog n=1 Tax=Leptodactylus fuscus TaxID=238119 RepID=UPI003F4EC286
MAARKEKLAKRVCSKENDSVRHELYAKLRQVLENRANANFVFDILEYMESEQEDVVLMAIRTCTRLFEALLEKGDIYIGDLPAEDDRDSDSLSAEDKYKIWMRDRYNSCLSRLVEFLYSDFIDVPAMALCMLMKFVQLEGKFPLESATWKDSYRFPRHLLKIVIDGLLYKKDTTGHVIDRFKEFLEYDDVRYYTMSLINESLAQAQNTKEPIPLMFLENVIWLLSVINMPDDGELTNYLITQKEKIDDWKPAKLKEHRKIFERVWMAFLKNKLTVRQYKKVLSMLHDSILPHMLKPALMIDFLTAAYDIGGSISLLALDGLFYLIHHHNLEYPNFYKKLYSLLNPSVFLTKYRARFFELANLFLSSTHLPVYLVAAFAKRLSRLSLTASPQALMMIIPFICNLIRRHPACRPLIHRPAAEDLASDPFIMEEEDPAKCRALESSLWELEALQNHYYPNVVRAANVISRALSAQETDISELLELSSVQLVEKDMKKKYHTVPLEFEPAQGFLGKKHDITADHFSLK